MKITVTAQVGRRYARFVAQKLRQASLMAARASSPPLSELSIVFINEKRMAELHRQFMNLPGPTDVLSFAIDNDADGRVTSGEVYVCVPYAQCQARARGVDPKHELLLYALHGMLHLLGYDDRTARAFHKMHQIEDQILTRLGIGAVFAPELRGGAR